MMKLWQFRKSAAALLFLLILLWAASRVDVSFRQEAGASSDPPSAASVPKAEPALPDESRFRLVSETDALRLKLDDATGHFLVEDKREGTVWRSYPNPEQWENETVGGLWKQHLASPLMFEYTDFHVYNTKPKLTNFLALGGTVKEITEIPGGVRLVYDMPALELSIAVQLRIVDDYVETKILDEGLAEGRYSMTWLRLYPFFGAEQSTGQEGYMLVPDGSGALITFDAHTSASRRVYEERVFGADRSFDNDPSSRLPVTMPVFGMKSGAKAFLAVMEEGAEYAKVYASPAGIYSQYNWIAGQMLYRSTYYQVTNRNKNAGFITYNKEERFGTDRTVKYFLLGAEDADYVGMAKRYRQYLMDEAGMTRLVPATEHLPLYVSVIGGGQKKGVLGERFVPITPFDRAAEMVESLKAQGVREINLTLLGWQQDGYTSFGGYAPPDERLGGTEGLKALIERADAANIPVQLALNYEANSTGIHGFKPAYHGMRDLAGTLLEANIWRSSRDTTLVSYGFTKRVFLEDLQRLKALGADGLLLQWGAQFLNSDFNETYGASRTEAAERQLSMFREAKETVGAVHGTNPNLYVVNTVDHIHDLYDDYSYDLFAERAVPFAQIALHGLKSYTSGYENQRGQFRNEFLKDIEYGAAPSYLLTHTPTRELTSVYGLELMSTTFEDWKGQAAEEYSRYNEALGDVQDEFIVNHRELAPGVRETTYSGGKRIVVNYNDNDYRVGDIVVPAKDFAVVEGEKSR